MSRNDLVTKLIRAGASGDQSLLDRTVDALINEELALKHHIFAQKIRDTLVEARQQQTFSQDLSKSSGYLRTDASDDVFDLLTEIYPERGLGSLYLKLEVHSQCQEIVEEHLAREKLRSHALEPRSRILLAGPPGNGKTSVARAIGYELGLPVYVLKYETVIGSFLGETSSRLKKVFDFIKLRPCVFFLDEFDTIAKERGDIHETGEIKRVVSTLLLQLDELPSHNLVIAATNHGELIDRAAWRRFELLLELTPPSTIQIQKFLSDQLRNFLNSNDLVLSDIAEQLYGASYANVEIFVADIKRRYIVENGSRSLENIVIERLSKMKNQYRSITSF